MKFKFTADCTFEANDIVDAMDKISNFFKEMNQEHDKVNKEIANQIKGEINIKPIHYDAQTRLNRSPSSLSA